MKFDITWIDSGREPQCAPDPRFPQGKDVTSPVEGPFCKAALPYPAKRCGYYRVVCLNCHVAIAVTTAGRPDDPRSIEVPCAKGKSS